MRRFDSIRKKLIRTTGSQDREIMIHEPSCTKNCENDPSKENLEELECLQAEYDDLYHYITQGAIIRSRANWYGKGEKNNKYFLNLEKSNKKKSCVRKIVTGDGTISASDESSEVYCHVLRTRKVHVSLFHGS